MRANSWKRPKKVADTLMFGVQGLAAELRRGDGQVRGDSGQRDCNGVVKQKGHVML